MANILDGGRPPHFNTPVTTGLNGVQKGLLLAFGLLLVLILQVTFFSSRAIASPLANNIDKVAETSKDFGKEAGNRAKDLAKNVKEGTKENIGKAKDAAKDAKGKIGDGADKANNKVNEAIDSVKSFLGQ
jgi:ElaB/YqjD/DUF883 family membrane-anchored ribosome-binding protein